MSHKRVYEQLHPETKHGGDRRSESSGNHCHLNSFADDTTAKTTDDYLSDDDDLARKYEDDRR